MTAGPKGGGSGAQQQQQHALSCPPEGSPVGALCRALAPFARAPPIEAVVFAWGASEDRQLGFDAAADCGAPKVVEALLGLQLMGCARIDR
jgi:hypothetical protein